MLKLELSEQMLAIVGAALAEQPYKVVAPVLAVIQQQVTEQRKPKASKEDAS